MKIFQTAAVLAAAVFALAAAGCYDQPEGVVNEETFQETFAREKEAAVEEGRINCCLKHPCSQCFAVMGGCPCAENLAKGEPVCHECKGGWIAGDGALEGIEAEDVPVMPRG